MRATCIKGRQNCCYGTEYQSVKHAVRDLQQRSWQPTLITDMPDMQQPIEFLGSYMMSHQDNDNKWGCTSTTNNKSQFSSVENNKRVADKINKDNMTPRHGQLQKYNNSTPQTMGTRRRKMRDEENWNAHPLKHVQSNKHPEVKHNS
jgi:hypothetical protein